MRAAILALILVAVGALLASRVELSGDLARMLPDSDPALNRASELLRRTLQRTVIDVSGGPDDAEAFVERMQASGYAVRTVLPEGELIGLLDLFRDRAALLIDHQAYAEMEHRIADAPARLGVLARRLQEPDGSHLARRAATDPLGFTDLALAPLGAMTAGLKDARILDGFVTSTDGRHRLVFVDPGFEANDTARTRRFLADLQAASVGLSVRHLGTHRSTLDNSDAIRRDVRLTAAVGTFAVLLLALLVFRRPMVALLALAPALFGAVIALGVYSLFRDTVAAAVAGFLAALLGVTIDYAVHVFSASRVPARAILMGATTTAGAFLALTFSALPGLRETGALGAAGVIVAALFAILVLPVRRRPPRDLSPAVRLLQGRPALLIVSVLALVALIGLKDVRLSGDVAALSRLSPETQRDEDAIRAAWGDAFRVTSVLVEGSGLEQALVSSEDLGYPSVLPSQRLQERRWERWRAFWTDSRFTGLQRALRAATEGTPFRPDAFELDWIRVRPAPLRLEDLPGDFVRDRIVKSDHGWLVNTPVFSDPPERVDGATVVNREAMVKRIATMVGTELKTLGLLAFGAVAVLVATWFGRLGPAIVVLAPLLAGAAVTFGLLGWLGIPLTLANAIFVVFLFGLAVDYAIFLAYARYERLRTGEDRVAESDSAVLLCALTTCAGFGSLVLASHPVLHSIGATALVGISSAAVVMQVLVPRLVPRSRPGVSVGSLYRDQGPVVSRYAPSKAKHDPVVEFAAGLGPRREVLVAGCGYGIMTARMLLAQPGQRLLGIDSDERKLTVARHALRRFPGAAFRRADLREADLGSPDLVVLVDVLHYWPEAEQSAILQRLVDALEPGGELLFREGCSDLGGHGWVFRGEAWARRIGFTRAGTGLFFRTRAGWLTLMKSCGLDVERTLPDAGAGSNVVYLCRKNN